MYSKEAFLDDVMTGHGPQGHEWRSHGKGGVFQRQRWSVEWTKHDQNNAEKLLPGIRTKHEHERWEHSHVT